MVLRIKVTHHSGIYEQHDAVHVKLRHWHRHLGRESEDGPCSSTCRGKTIEPRQRHKPAGYYRDHCQNNLIC